MLLSVCAQNVLHKIFLQIHRPAYDRQHVGALRTNSGGQTDHLYKHLPSIICRFWLWSSLPRNVMCRTARADRGGNLKDIFSSLNTSWNADRWQLPAGGDEQGAFLSFPPQLDEPWMEAVTRFVLIDAADFLPELPSADSVSALCMPNKTSAHDFIICLCNVWPHFIRDDSAHSCQAQSTLASTSSSVSSYAFDAAGFTSDVFCAGRLHTWRLSVTLMLHLSPIYESALLEGLAGNIG